MVFDQKNTHRYRGGFRSVSKLGILCTKLATNSKGLFVSVSIPLGEIILATLKSPRAREKERKGECGREAAQRLRA